jgi:hypothetical protein
MARLLLTRTRKADNQPTLGVLYAREATPRELCLTLEEPWRDADHDGLGDTGVSCIPAGTYKGFIRVSRKKGGTGKRDYDVPQLERVPGRGAIQIHIGNTLDHTEGCILVGLSRTKGGGFIENSTKAFKRVMDYLGDGPFEIEVVDPPAAVA